MLGMDSTWARLPMLRMARGSHPRGETIALWHPPPLPGPDSNGNPGHEWLYAPQPSDQGVGIEEISKSSNQTTSSAVVAQSELDPPKKVLK